MGFRGDLIGPAWVPVSELLSLDLPEPWSPTNPEILVALPGMSPVVDGSITASLDEVSCKVSGETFSLLEFGGVNPLDMMTLLWVVPYYAHVTEINEMSTFFWHAPLANGVVDTAGTTNNPKIC